jgi:tRNA(Phe) wybutosine-synthesizing methylase Tyw3
MKKYLATYYYSCKIFEVELERETEKSYWSNGLRKLKESDGEKLFDTYEEAKSFLIKKQEDRIRRAQANLNRLRNELEELKNQKVNEETA